jgi:hypothetical protein
LIGHDLELLVFVGVLGLRFTELRVRRARAALQLKILVAQAAVLLLGRELLELDVVRVLLDFVEVPQQLRVLLIQDPQLLVLHLERLICARLARLAQVGHGARLRHPARRCSLLLAATARRLALGGCLLGATASRVGARARSPRRSAAAAVAVCSSKATRYARRAVSAVRASRVL